MLGGLSQLTGLVGVMAFSRSGRVKMVANMTRRVLKIFLIFALLTGQPAMAGHLKLYHGDCEHIAAAAMTADMHHPMQLQQAVARHSFHMHDNSDADTQCGSCGACCVALVPCFSFIASVDTSPRPEPVQMLFAQPDLAAAIDPPRC